MLRWTSRSQGVGWGRKPPRGQSRRSERPHRRLLPGKVSRWGWPSWSWASPVGWWPEPPRWRWKWWGWGPSCRWCWGCFWRSRTRWRAHSRSRPRRSWSPGSIEGTSRRSCSAWSSTARRPGSIWRCLLMIIPGFSFRSPRSFRCSTCGWLSLEWLSAGRTLSALLKGWWWAHRVQSILKISSMCISAASGRRLRFPLSGGCLEALQPSMGSLILWWRQRPKRCLAERWRTQPGWKWRRERFAGFEQLPGNRPSAWWRRWLGWRWSRFSFCHNRWRCTSQWGGQSRTWRRRAAWPWRTHSAP